MNMKMLVILTRGALEFQLEDVFIANGVKGYTTFHSVEGAGETGATPSPFYWPGLNVLTFVVLPTEKAERLVHDLKSLHKRKLQDTHERPIPFKVFSLPCEEEL